MNFAYGGTLVRSHQVGKYECIFFVPPHSSLHRCATEIVYLRTSKPPTRSPRPTTQKGDHRHQNHRFCAMASVEELPGSVT